MQNPISRFKQYISGNALLKARDEFEKASIRLLMNYAIIGFSLTSVFSFSLYLQGYEFVATINGVVLVLMLLVFVVLKQTGDVRKAAAVYIIIQQLGSVAWGLALNFSTEPEQVLWLLLNVLITFFIMGNKWGFIIAGINFIHIVFALINRSSGYQYVNNHFAEIPEVNPVALAVPFLLDIFILREFVRTRAIAEKQIKETNDKNMELLLNILPAETAGELRENGAAKARSYDQVTVMFTDFKNFTQVAEQLTAEELVKQINYWYSEFDRIISKYNVEKIKTIGDSYMCAGGLPVPNQTNASDVVHAAFEIRNFMNNYSSGSSLSKSGISIGIRIGIHTGPVITGVVGLKKFTYDIWGDAVNMAARMEQHGEAGKINISGSTYELIKDQFTCTSRGRIAAKNKGEVEMYFVEGMN